ncbi:MAG: YIP1 family protein [Saccharofermentanales bacterium]
MTIKRKFLQQLTGILVAASLIYAIPAITSGTSFSYTYDYWNSSVPVPAPYTADKPLSGLAFGDTGLDNPTDIFVGEDNLVYILDAGNNRIVVLDENLAFVRQIGLTDKDGAAIEFQEALGLFVDRNSRLYVADKTAKSVYITDSNGQLESVIGAPPSEKVEEGFDYTPSRVVADTAGIVYVISANTYSGALQYDQKQEFLGFYGSERVTVTAQLLWDIFWKNLLSETQSEGIMRSVPTSFINFDIDRENFIYTIKGGTGLGVGQIRKLNPMGTNILFNERGQLAQFGDIETWFDSQANLTIATVFNDLAADDEGFITALDSTRNRLFQYDQNSSLLYAFSGSGSQYGTFKTPIAIETLGDRLLVLDSGYNSLTVLTPTVFGRNVREAISLYNDGLYEEAMLPWEEILKRDSSYELANIGMGKIYERIGDYDLTMQYYRKGNDKKGYSEAFSAKRDNAVRKYFVPALVLTVLLLIAMVLIVNYKERHRKSEYDQKISVFRYPWHCILHPFKAYYDLKVEKKGSLLIANLILGAFFIVSIISTQLTGFHFNRNRTDQFNVFITLGMTIGIYIVWILCNWAISTLADGEGTRREIWIFTAYALLPYVVSLVVLTALSNVLTLEESGFLMIARTLAYGWTGINLVMATREVHQYTLRKTVIIIGGTLLGVYLVLLFLTIGYSMFTQLISFISMIYNELRLR